MNSRVSGIPESLPGRVQYAGELRWCVGVEGALASMTPGETLLPQEEWRAQERPVLSVTHRQPQWENSPKHRQD